MSEDDDDDERLPTNKFDMRGLPHIPVRVPPPRPPPPQPRHDTDDDIDISKLKIAPYGPIIDVYGNGINLFKDSKNKRWVKNMKSEGSVKFGSMILHLYDC